MPLFITFLMAMVSITNKPTFRKWHDNHVTQNPLLSHQHMTFARMEAFALAEIATNFHYKEELTSGRLIMASKNKPVVEAMS